MSESIPGHDLAAPADVYETFCTCHLWASNTGDIDIAAGMSFYETTSMAVQRSISCNADQTVAIDGTHFFSFPLPIIRGILYDTQGIYPNILDFQFPRYNN
jgi:hypothetical protein